MAHADNATLTRFDMRWVIAMLDRSPELRAAYREDHQRTVAEMKRAWFQRDLDRGEKLLDRIAFWQEIPIVGEIVCGVLADKLDAISAELEAA